MISLRRLQQVLQYDPLTGIFRWRERLSYRIHIGDVAGVRQAKGYICIGIDHKIYYAHRLAWLYMTGKWPTAEIDHRRGKSNRWRNLRSASSTENKWNARRQKNNTSGVKGVTWNKASKRWKAAIKANGVRFHLGYFATLTAAKNARRDAARTHHGKFRRA